MGNPLCAVRGSLGPGAMCGFVIVGAKECGLPALGQCEHQRVLVDCAACNGAEGLPCSHCGGSGKVQVRRAAMSAPAAGEASDV